MRRLPQGPPSVCTRRQVSTSTWKPPKPTDAYVEANDVCGEITLQVQFSTQAAHLLSSAAHGYTSRARRRARLPRPQFARAQTWPGRATTTRPGETNTRP